MPLCFWAAQTAVMVLDVGVGVGRLAFTPYLPPHMAATAIQRAYCSHVITRMYNDWESDAPTNPLVMLAKLADNLDKHFAMFQRLLLLTNDLFAFAQRKRIGAFPQRKRIGHKLAKDYESCHLDNG
jgi:hypothetical protein